MAIIKCTECGNEVSTKAETCPHCGAKNKQPSIGKKFMVWLFGSLAVLYFIGSCSMNESSGLNSSTTRPATVIAASNVHPPAPIENWLYDSYEDKISGKSFSTASTFSKNSHQFAFPYQGGSHASLTLRKHPRFGQNIYFSITKGQLVCSSGSGCTVDIRIDDGKPFKVSASVPDDYDNTTLFLSGYTSLKNKIKKGKTMVISASAYKEGTPTFEFNIAGLKWE